MAVDLHIHSTASDGCLTPAQVVDLAASKGLSAIALTDHDTVDGLSQALERGGQVGLAVLPGIEMSCEVGEQEYHILGYCLDFQSPKLHSRLHRLLLSRENRLQLMVERLDKSGVRLDFTRVMEIAGDGAVGRPHIAQAMIERGYVNSRAEAFARYLNRGQPGWVAREKILPRDAIQLIRQVGGVPVWAHPGRHFTPEVLNELMNFGLMGIEAWHPDHPEQHARAIAAEARYRNLIVTGGSDFHCSGEGWTLGSYAVPDWTIDQLMEQSNKPLPF